MRVIWDVNDLCPKLIALTDVERYPHSADAIISLCHDAQAGSIAVILRDRSLSSLAKLEVGRRLRQVTSATGQFLLVADRYDLFLALNADGMHLGSRALHPSRLRRLVPWLSRAGHGLTELGATEIGLLDAVLVSPAFQPLKGKPQLGSVGLLEANRSLRQICELSPPKTYALGGVDQVNTASALTAGCFGVATISAILPEAGRGQLLEALAIRAH